MDNTRETAVSTAPRRFILVADDEPHIVTTLCHVLHDEGFAVAGVFDGKQVLDFLELGPRPDLILLDVMMPRMDGFQVLDRLNADPRFEPIPVAMLTQKQSDADVFRGWTNGVTDYLIKPVQKHELSLLLGRLLT